MSTTKKIISNDKKLIEPLIKIYKNQIKQLHNTLIAENKTLVQVHSLILLKESCERFKPEKEKLNRKICSFNIKYDLYRLPVLLIDHLANYFFNSKAALNCLS